MRQKILIGVDGSEPSQEATAYAITLCKRLGCDLIGLRVVDDKRYASEWEAVRQSVSQELEANAVKILEGVRTQAKAAGIDVETEIRHGDASSEIIKFATENRGVMMIVLASSGRTRIKRQFFGSTTERVARQVSREVPCAVVITPSRCLMEEARTHFE